MKQNDLLIINDVTGYGRVSTFAMLPVLAKYGIHAYLLPTALVSNTMDYGSCEILDTTDFMARSIEKWNEFGFSFNNISTGLINSQEQVDLICSFIDSQQNAFVIVDPIMADDGKIYPGMYENAVECNKKLSAKADILIPNITEATLLSDLHIGRTVFSNDEYREILSKLSDLGPKKIIITDCSDSNKNHFNIVYDNLNGNLCKLPYQRQPAKCVGTGDVFSACIIGEIINGTAINDAVEKASVFVSHLVKNNLNRTDKYDIDIETSLSIL